jgi:hypothetical protein
MMAITIHSVLHSRPVPRGLLRTVPVALLSAGLVFGLGARTLRGRAGAKGVDEGQTEARRRALS